MLTDLSTTRRKGGGIRPRPVPTALLDRKGFVVCCFRLMVRYWHVNKHKVIQKHHISLYFSCQNMLIKKQFHTWTLISGFHLRSWLSYLKKWGQNDIAVASFISQNVLWLFMPFCRNYISWKVHGLRTLNEAFLHWNPEILDLGRQIGQMNSGAFGVFLSKLSAINYLVQFRPNSTPLFLQKN